MPGDRLVTQARLIAATRALIVAEGLEACTLENICQRAGFTRGAFYSNFGTKDALLAEMAEEEYRRYIAALNQQVEVWARRHGEGGRPPRIETLLFEAIDSLGFNASLYVLHSELLMRSIRNPKWGARLMQINNEFVESLGAALQAIIEHSGRRLTFPRRALTHAVIGVVTRAAGIDSWHRRVVAISAQPGTFTAGGDEDAAHLAQNTAAAAPTGVADSSTRDIVEAVLLLLHGASVPA